MKTLLTASALLATLSAIQFQSTVALPYTDSPSSSSPSSPASVYSSYDAGKPDAGKPLPPSPQQQYQQQQQQQHQQYEQSTKDKKQCPPNVNSKYGGKPGPRRHRYGSSTTTTTTDSYGLESTLNDDDQTYTTSGTQTSSNPSFTSTLSFLTQNNAPKSLPRLCLKKKGSETGEEECVERESLTHLIMVPGHTVFTGTDLTRVGDEESWYLESYQKGQLSTFIAHIREAVHIADADPHSLLIFSGGQTRLPAGPRTEAQSYYTAAQTSNWFNPTHSTPTSLSLRATTEEHARDSFENVLFSIARFREYTGRYPERITVVGFGFKKMRFVDLHRGALRWPVEKYEYVSVDPPSGLEKAMEGEMQNSVKHFREDLYGCRGTLLEKKLSRDPFARTVPYLLSCPEMRELLAYCPQDNSVFPGMLPWSSQ